MDAMVTTALVGTAQQHNLDTTTGTPVDALIGKLPAGEAERKLLLSAGVCAIYQQAGRMAESLPTAPEPATPESLPTCSPEAATLLESLLKGEHDELLPEALERMRQVGLRVPHEMLPTVLDIQGTELRAAMFHVVGERGRWLSQFNPAWSWVANYLPGTEETHLAHAEMIWQEGTLGQRQAVLRLMRGIDPAKARAWLMATWKQEKADARTELLGTFETSLSAEDEEFLEKELDDRAAGVRSAAASLLAHLATSALAKRMQERADAMLDYAAKKLIVTLPTALEKDWLRDGIQAKPTTSGVGEHAWWFTQVFSFVSPSHWEERFALSIDKLIAAAYANDDWGETLIASWSSAALLHNNVEWCVALWDWWCKKHRGTSAWGVRTSLLARMSQQEAEQRVLNVLSNLKHPGRKEWEEALAVLPKPWSREFAEVYLQELRKYISSINAKKMNSSYYDSWYQSLSTAIMALPPECFATALERWIIPDADDDKTNWQIEYWRQELNTFREAIRLRQRLMKEITHNSTIAVERGHTPAC